MRGVDPGFAPEGLLTARVELSPVRYESNEQIRAFYERLVRRLETIPGVRSAAAVKALPMTQLELGDWSFLREGRYSLPPRPSEWSLAYWQATSAGYFETMRIPVLQGRGIRGHRSDRRTRRGGHQPHARTAGLARRRRAGPAHPDGRRRDRLGLAHRGGHRGRRAASWARCRPAARDLPAARPVPGGHRSRRCARCAWSSAPTATPPRLTAAAPRGPGASSIRTFRWPTCRRWRRRWAPGPRSGGSPCCS